MRCYISKSGTKIALLYWVKLAFNNAPFTNIAAPTRWYIVMMPFYHPACDQGDVPSSPAYTHFSWFRIRRHSFSRPGREPWYSEFSDDGARPSRDYVWHSAALPEGWKGQGHFKRCVSDGLTGRSWRVDSEYDAGKITFSQHLSTISLPYSIFLRQDKECVSEDTLLWPILMSGLTVKTLCQSTHTFCSVPSLWQATD